MTLTEFLLACIAEDEADAQDATPGPWWNESGTVHAPYPFGRDLTAGNGGACHPLNAQGSNGRDADADAEHASRHDPGRVLAECAAKRAIVALHSSEDGVRYGYCEQCWDGNTPLPYPCLTLRILALPYAEHEQFQEEWNV